MGFVVRWLFAFVLVAVTYNPTQWNYVSWASRQSARGPTASCGIAGRPAAGGGLRHLLARDPALYRCGSACGLVGAIVAAWPLGAVSTWGWLDLVAMPA